MFEKLYEAMGKVVESTMTGYKTDLYVHDKGRLTAAQPKGFI